MYVPNGVGAFGSTFKEIDDLDEGWNFDLTRTHWKYLDKPSQHCDEEIRQDIYKTTLYQNFTCHKEKNAIFIRQRFF